MAGGHNERDLSGGQDISDDDNDDDDDDADDDDAMGLPIIKLKLSMHYSIPS